VLTFVGATEQALVAGSAAFAASKGALHEFVRALARDLDGSGVVARAVLLDDASAADSQRVVDAMNPSATGPLPAGGGLFPSVP